ncbi:hypothetical protein EV1_004665 [Malus domestica]
MAPSAAAGAPRGAAALSIGAGAGTPTSSAAPNDEKLTRTIVQMVVGWLSKLGLSELKPTRTWAFQN